MPVSLAQAALQYAKKCVPLGTNNQGSGQLSAPKTWNPPRDPGTRHEANLTVRALKEMAPPHGCTMAEVIQYGRKVSNQGAGNCFEQCAAASVFLSGSGEHPQFLLARLNAPGDHVFVVINQNPGHDGFFPDDFANWNADAVIIDPWARADDVAWKTAPTTHRKLSYTAG